MVAFDSRRVVDPTLLLGPDVVAALRAALVDQRAAGSEPTIALERAIIAGAEEARARQLSPEWLLIQLKALADEMGLRQPEQGVARANGSPHVREWMVGVLLRAYWNARDT